MATFAGQAAKQGQGVAYWLDVSLDKFATVAYRWGTLGGKLDGANVYDARLVSLGRFEKAFSVEHIAGASTIEVKLDNTDRGVDWMVDQATSYQVFYARARLYVGLYDASSSAAPANLASKQLGEFVIAYFPERDDTHVSFTLSDDLLGILNQPVGTPTLDDWSNDAGSSAANCPMKAGGDFTYLLNQYEMVPLAFGSDWTESRMIGTASQSSNVGLLVCATTETTLNTAASWNEANMTLGVRFAAPVQNISSVFGGGPVGLVWSSFLSVPTSFTVYSTSYSIWSAKVSQTLTKGGKSYLVLWIQLDTDNFYKWLTTKIGINYNPLPAATKWDKSSLMANISGWFVKDAGNISQGIKLSGVTQYAAKTHAADVVADLITYYSSDGSASYVDTSSFARARSDIGWGQASGIIHPGLDQTPDERAKGVAAPSRTSLREHITGICRAADLDVYVTWSGTIGLSSLWNDYSAVSPIWGGVASPIYSIAEERTAAQMDATPSNGDRWAPYNRILLADIKTDPVSGAQLASPGPYDNPDANAQDWKTKLEVTWQLGWTPMSMQAGNPWYTRHAEQKVRPAFRFLTDIEAVANLDLGGLFYANWTRNFGASLPYTNSVFQVEAIALNPADGSVEIRAIWRNELTTDLPYLLDDESLLTRATGSGARTATVADTSSTVTFSSGSLVTDGVQVNDTLILKDSTEAAASFKRNKALKITAVTDATHLVVSDPIDSLDFGGGGAVQSWEIRKSFRTYPDASSDPVNYPDGSRFYGKIADNTASGVFSDSTAANKLLNG